MSDFFDAIDDRLAGFIAKQQMFFVATAPLSDAGRVNVSPKGLDCFRVLGPNRVAYLDLTGSGNETSAHIAENGRITFMFCAFDGAPMIVRLYGRGETALPGSSAWDELRPLFGEYPGARQIVDAAIDAVQTSCGYAVPLYAFEGQRDTLIRWADHKGPDGIQTYRREKNGRSIDGLPTAIGATSVQGTAHGW